MFCSSRIKNYIITGLISNFFFMHLVTGWHLLCREEITIIFSCLLYRRVVRRLMNALEVEYVCFREISMNVNKLFTLLLFVYFVYVVLAVLLLLLYWFCCCFYLFIRWLCKHVHYFFIFGAFAYHLNNTISISVTIRTTTKRIVDHM